MAPEVSDDVDVAQDIPLRWPSVIYDLLGILSVKPMGQATLHRYIGYTPGHHQLRVIATDFRQNAEASQINVCQQFGYEVENLDISTWPLRVPQAGTVPVSGSSSRQPFIMLSDQPFATAVSVSDDNAAIDFDF